MANQQHLDILLREGVPAWNQWRNEHPAIRPDLSEADLSTHDLSEADLHFTDLRLADLQHATPRDANLYGANLFRANLRDADLSGVYFGGLDRTGAYFIGIDEADPFRMLFAKIQMALLDASLRATETRGANLREANLHGANLSGLALYGMDLYGVDLSEANLAGTDLRGPDLTGADLTRADLTGSNLSGVSCLRTNFSGARLIDCIVYGISAWDVNLKGAEQANLRITPFLHHTNITVDNLEVAQFLYLLLHNEKVRAVLDTITSKVVLILGRFGERKPTLEALREAIRTHPNGYIPILFDFEPQQEKPILDTVKTLSNLARFVIADLTDPNMVRSELTYILSNVPTVPVQPLIEQDARLPTEYGTWQRYATFLPIYHYANLSQLLAGLNDAVIPSVEGHVQARRLILDRD